MLDDMIWVLPVVSLCAAINLSTGIRYMNICKWSNEGCTSNEECCSERCLQVHPGTNSRCTRTDMGGLCLYSFHCGHRMECGQRNRCCARHWGTCSMDKDCCIPYHTCQQISGFVYRKCLPRNIFLSAAHVQRHSSLVYGAVFIVTFNTVVNKYIL